ncbi:hypothetical protein [Arthrobacter sp. E3]|uniref:hypothetical protein n=1 Tax=Arthrobacter sp. E3 TaxID=517402 RepID=UPI001A94F7A7|nr:hypothetical protein [Arthrobacter sp. E3]
MMSEPNPLAPNLFEILVVLAPVVALAALVLYLVLRFVVWAPKPEKILETVRKHALWTGLIAWALSSLVAAGQAGIYPPGQLQAVGSAWALIPWFAIFAPIVAVLGVHAIGQASWPAPKSPQRAAVLEFRRARDFVEPALGAVVLGVFIFSAGTLVWLAFTPAFPALEPLSSIVGTGWAGATNGRIEGYVLAAALGAALLVLTFGTLLVMRLIASRRSLETLTSEQNRTLRVIGMNRLLRVCVTIASGLASIAGNFMVQPIPNPDVISTSWINWIGVVNVVILGVMLMWKPPFLGASDDSVDSSSAVPELALGDGPAAAKVGDSALSVVLPVILVLGLASATLLPWHDGLSLIFLEVVALLLTFAGSEFLISRNYARPGRPRVQLGKPLPWPLWAALLLAAMGLALVLSLLSVPSSAGNTPNSLFLTPPAYALAIPVIGTLAGALVLQRPALNNSPCSFDTLLRRRSLFRIGRTVAGGWFAILGVLLPVVPSDPNPLALQFNTQLLGILCMLIGALLLLFPVRKFTPADYCGQTPVPLPDTSSSGR